MNLLFMPKYGMKSFHIFLEEKITKKKHDFSTVLFLLPDQLSDDIYDFGLKTISDKDLFHKDGEPKREDEIHCTVLYGIHDDTSHSVREALKDTEPFTVKLGKLSVFTKPPEFDVVKIEVISPPLHQIHKKIKNKVENTTTFPT